MIIALVVLVSAIHHESAIGIHMSPPSCITFLLPILSHPSRMSQSIGFEIPYHRANSHWLSILHAVMYVFQCCSFHSSPPHLLPLCLKVCPLSLLLYHCLANRFISTIFLDCIIYEICFSLYDLLYAV